MAQYYIGDTHFGHLKVALIRGFSCIEEHDEFLINQLMELPQDEETQVNFLGDVSPGSHREDYALEIISQFGFQKHLIAGNHDSVSSVHSKGRKQQKRWLEVFDSVSDYGNFNMMKTKVLMSHYPYAAMGDGDGRSMPGRYLPFRMPDVGNPLMHAHTHQDHPFSKVREETITKIEFEGYDLNSMCVSWDSRRGITTERDVVKWLEMREIVKRNSELEKVRNYWGAFPKPEAS